MPAADGQCAIAVSTSTHTEAGAGSPLAENQPGGGGPGVSGPPASENSVEPKLPTRRAVPVRLCCIRTKPPGAGPGLFAQRPANQLCGIATPATVLVTPLRKRTR